MSSIGRSRDERLLAGLVRLALRLEDARVERWHERGLTLRQLRVLWRIAAGPGVTLGDIASHLDCVPSTASGVVDRLVRSGLVERRDGAADRRHVDLRLTRAGRELVGDSPAWLAAAVGPRVRAFSDAELDELVGAVERLTALFDDDDPGQEPPRLTVLQA